MEIIECTNEEDFHRKKHYVIWFSSQKIILFEKKYDLKLITLISVYHLKPVVSLERLI